MTHERDIFVLVCFSSSHRAKGPGINNDGSEDSDLEKMKQVYFLHNRLVLLLAKQL